MAEAGRAVADLVQGGRVDVELRGEADVAGMRLPLDLGGRFGAR